MERLKLGDMFWPADSDRNPYTVRAVLKDGYLVQQNDDTKEQYDIKTIHGLFSNRSWVVKRLRNEMFTPAHADLFTI